MFNWLPRVDGSRGKNKHVSDIYRREEQPKLFLVLGCRGYGQQNAALFFLILLLFSASSLFFYFGYFFFFFIMCWLLILAPPSLSSRTGSELHKSTPVSSSCSSTRPPQAPSLTPAQQGVTHLTPLTPLVVPPAAAANTPVQCSSLIPVLLPQHATGGAYAVYLPSSTSSSSAKPNPLSRPQPTSLVVRSMTFEDKSLQSPTAHCAATKRPHSDSSSRSPLLAKKSNTSLKVIIIIIYC